MVFFDSNALSLLSIVSVGLLRGLFYYEKMVLYFLKFLKIFPDCMLHYIMKTTATMCLYIYIIYNISGWLDFSRENIWTRRIKEIAGMVHICFKISNQWKEQR